MSKEEMLRILVAQRQYSLILELLRSARNTGELDEEVGVGEFPDTRFLKLIHSVRGHLRFLEKFGEGVAHVEDEHGEHHFARPERLEEWLKLDAPGVDHSKVEQLYFDVSNQLHL